MPDWGWIVIAVLFVAVVAIAAWALWSKRRTERLQETFGPEYKRTVGASDDRRRAESELETRRERRERLDIRPLTPEARDHYAEAWRDSQARFVDAPDDAVQEADRLITKVMRERGYPMEDFDRRAEDISVDHPGVVEDYRAAHAISLRTEDGSATTEDLRQAMVHYRALFDDLLGAEEPSRAEEGR